MNQFDSRTIGVSASTDTTTTPGIRTLNQIDASLDQLVDTLTSLDKALSPVLIHAAPEPTKAQAEIRETGQSPIHQSLLDIQQRIQRATQAVASLRERVTL